MANSLPAIATIIYFALYVLLLIVLAFYVHKTENHSSTKSFLNALWKKKGIYGHIIVHLYDTATDIGVLIQWGILAENEANGDDIKSLNMSVLFGASLAFLLIYRLISTCTACISTTEIGWWCCGDLCLGLLDMYVIKVVYQAIKDDEKEPTTK
eukprot:25408_1